jgi:hypothetical protein
MTALLYLYCWSTCEQIYVYLKLVRVLVHTQTYWSNLYWNNYISCFSCISVLYEPVDVCVFVFLRSYIAWNSRRSQFHAHGVLLLPYRCRGNYHMLINSTCSILRNNIVHGTGRWKQWERNTRESGEGDKGKKEKRKGMIGWTNERNGKGIQ